MSFEFLEHTADIIVRATGKDLEEAFKYAAFGFYGVMTDLSKVLAKETISVAISSEDVKSLLYDWIDQLIFLFDTEYFVAKEIEITKFILGENNLYTLEATLQGEPFEIGRHEQRSEVKAMTYSYMKISDNIVEFTLDL